MQSTAPKSTSATIDPTIGFLTKVDIVRLTKFSRRKIDGMMAEKRLPFVKVGRSVRFRWPAVEAALLRYELKEIGRPVAVKPSHPFAAI